MKDCIYKVNPEDYPGNEIDPCEFCPLDRCPISEPHHELNAVELLTLLSTLKDCIDDTASANETTNTTILHQINPDSLRWVLDQTIDYIIDHDTLII